MMKKSDIRKVEPAGPPSPVRRRRPEDEVPPVKKTAPGPKLFSEQLNKAIGDRLKKK